MTERAPLRPPVVNFIESAPGGVPPKADEPAGEPQGTAARPAFREREATRNMSLNVPKSLYEDLRAYMKLTDTPMTEVLVEGAKKELARLKKQYGIE